jgi:hypothetical protein
MDASKAAYKSSLLELSNGITLIIQVIASTNVIFKIFDQTIFQTARSVLPRTHATTDVTNSGNDVHNASMVTPTILSGMTKSFAIFMALLTTISQPYISPNNQHNIYQSETM